MTLPNIKPTLITSAAIGAAAIGGTLVGFSTFIMRALRRLPDRDGLVAMQSINKTAETGPFFAGFLGTSVLCAGLGISAARHPDEPASRYVKIGSALYLSGFVLTMIYHVPRNTALGRLDPDSSAAGEKWRSYAVGWTAWNHVRALTMTGAVVPFALAWRSK